MPGWQASNGFSALSLPDWTALNNLANDIRTWGGDVNAGGNQLQNLAGIGGVASVVVSVGSNERGRFRPSGLQVTGVGADLATTGIKESICHVTGSLFAGLSIHSSSDAAGGWLIGTSAAGVGDFALVRNQGVGLLPALRMLITSGGRVGFGMVPTTQFGVAGLQAYADNNAATLAGHGAGNFYRTSTGVVMVVF